MNTNIKINKANSYRLLQESLRNKAMTRGVTLIAPETIFLSKDTKFGRNVIIEPYVVIGSNVKIGNSVLIKSFSHLEGARVENKVTIGPYARIRPGTNLKSNSKIGNFVETKKTKIGKSSKANHFSYLGDAEIGKEVNIGAGTITCNYDGKDKHKTKIGDASFVGTNSSLVAPVNIGKNAYVGAGSTITKDIPDNALGVGRGKQKNKENWSKNKK